MTIKITLTPESRPLTDAELETIYRMTANGIEVEPLNITVPLPWDADLGIENGNFILNGNFGQQGTHPGSVVVILPLDKVSKYYVLSVTIPDGKYASLYRVASILLSAGWLIPDDAE
jgi:hypothetical protein